MSDPNEPGVLRLMKAIARAREEVAPQLPMYARRAPHPLASLEEHFELYESMPFVFDELHCAYVQEYGPRSTWRRTASMDEAVSLMREPYLEAVE
ncbi:MAG: hypothetical protein ACRDL5_07970, partial [Solirubrobacteraceae bacterium]